MKNTFYKPVVFVIAIFFLIGCSSIEELKIGNIRNVEFKGMNNNILSLAITVPIENPNSFRIKLKDAELTVTTGETLLGKIKQAEDIIINGRSSNDYKLQVNVELAGQNTNMLSLYSLINSKPDIRLSGFIKVRSGLYRKKYRIKDYRVEY